MVNIIQKLKNHYNNNGLYYWLFSLIPSFFSIQWLLDIINNISSFMSTLQYENLYLNNDIIGIIALGLTFYIIYLLKKIEKEHKISIIHQVINYILIFLSIIIIVLVVNRIDYSNRIKNNISIVKPFISIEEQKSLNLRFYKVANKKDYESLIKYLDPLIKDNLK